MIPQNEALTCYYGGGGRDYQAVTCASATDKFCMVINILLNICEKTICELIIYYRNNNRKQK